MENFNMNKEELKKFFNKYNSFELKKIDNMFQFVSGYETKQPRRVLEEVYICKDSKSNTFDKNYRIGELTEKELAFLYELTDSTLMCLSSIKNPNSEQKIVDSSKLLSSIEYEMEKRKVKEKVRIY